MVFSRAILFLWLLSMISFRPGLLAEQYGSTSAIFLLSTFTLIIYFAGNGKYVFKIPQTKHRAIIYLIICIMCLYLFFQSQTLSSAKNNALNSVIAIFIGSSCICIALSRYQSIILRYFVLIHFVLSLSIILTFLLLIPLHFNDDALTIATFMSNKTNEIKILFPFSLTWSHVPFNEVGLNLLYSGETGYSRFIGVYREPGAAQYVFLTAFFIALYLPIRRNKVIATCIAIASVLMFSLQAFIDLFIGICIYLLFKQGKKQRKITAASSVLLLVSAATIVYASTGFDFGIKYKLASGSGWARLTSFQIGFDKFKSIQSLAKDITTGFRKAKELRTLIIFPALVLWPSLRRLV